MDKLIFVRTVEIGLFDFVPFISILYGNEEKGGEEEKVGL
jgi:hypothetical protein